MKPILDFVTRSLRAKVMLVVLALKPDRFPWIVDAALFLILAEVLAGTIIFGGLVPSE